MLRRQAVGVDLKHSSVLFTSCFTLNSTCNHSIHTMDTTFNNSTWARALNRLVTVALYHTLERLYLQYIERLQKVPCRIKISAALLHFSNPLWTWLHRQCFYHSVTSQSTVGLCCIYRETGNSDIIQCHNTFPLKSLWSMENKL